MRVLPSFHLSYPYLKSASVAAGVAAAAGLLVLGACSDSVTSKIAAPKDLTPRFGIVGDNSHLVKVCVDPSSSAGTYKFAVAKTTVGAWPYPTFELQFSADVVFPGTTQNSTGPFSSGGDNDVVPSSPVSLTRGASLVCANVFTRATTVNDADNRLVSFGGKIWNPAASVLIHPILGAGVTYTVSCINDDATLPQDTAASSNPPAPVACTNGADGTKNMFSSANVYHGSVLTYTFHAPSIGACTLGYPSNTTPIDGVNRGQVVFNESSVLDTVTTSGDELRLWAVDEHATTLGVNKVSIKTGGGTSITEYSGFSTMGLNNPASALNPNVGTTALAGDQRGTDPVNRPLWPSVFITDITADGTSKAGDWQNGAPNGATSPSAIYGTWKAAAVFIDKTKTPNTRTITPGADPQTKNHLNVGYGTIAGAAQVPAGVQDLGFTAEVVWKLGDLKVGGGPLIAGHSYRVQFMVHDGDQNKTGGDVGQACVTLNL
jgi:hypothetical protein